MKSNIYVEIIEFALGLILGVVLGIFVFNKYLDKPESVTETINNLNQKVKAKKGSEVNLSIPGEDEPVAKDSIDCETCKKIKRECRRICREERRSR